MKDVKDEDEESQKVIKNEDDDSAVDINNWQGNSNNKVLPAI